MENVMKWYFTNENSINLRAEIYTPKKYEVKHLQYEFFDYYGLLQAFSGVLKFYLDFEISKNYILHWLTIQSCYMYENLHTVQWT